MNKDNNRFKCPKCGSNKVQHIKEYDKHIEKYCNFFICKKCNHKDWWSAFDSEFLNKPLEFEEK